MFPTTSRYHDIKPVKYIAPDGRQIVYLLRRFLPTEQPTILTKYTITEGDRLDNITARYLDDPKQFWRLCDANHAMHPDELTSVIGQQINIPLVQ